MLKLKSMTWPQIRGDLFGGITAGVVALPLALAFGVQSGLGAEAGLYGAMILGFFAALLGGTNTQISGPTGPITVLTGGLIAVSIQNFGSLENALPVIFFTFCLASIFQVLMGIFKLGQYIRYVPYPVISGFMSGIGILIIILQIYPSMGLSSPSNVNDIVYGLFHTLDNVNYQAIALCAGTVFIIYLFPLVTKAIPSALFALIVMSLVAFYLKLNVPIIGAIPHGLPALQFEIIDAFHINLIYHAIWPALTIAALGALDSLLTALIADKKTHTFHDSDKELIGQGVGNFLTSLFGGIPGAGATMRTVVNINSGGVSRLSGMIHGILLVMLLLGLGPFAELIPLPVLAGILFTVGISIIDYKGLKHLFKIPRTDALITLAVLGLTVFVGLLEAVVIGFVIASCATISKVSEWSKNTSEIFPAAMLSEEQNIPKEVLKHTFIKHVEGPLFFGFTSYFRTLTHSIPDIQIVVIRMLHVPYIDQSGLYALEDTIAYLNHKGITVYFTGINPEIKAMLHNTQVIPNAIPESHVFDSFDQFMQSKFNGIPATPQDET